MRMKNYHQRSQENLKKILRRMHHLKKRKLKKPTKISTLVLLLRKRPIKQIKILNRHIR
jgi:hypothetical protein